MANVVPIRKKNREIQICIDFRNLNLSSLKDNYPLPNMEHVLQPVTGSGMMSMLNRFSSYNQVSISKDDKYKTVFTTPWGTYAYVRMLFGLINTRATFQRAMDFAFCNYLYKSIVI